MSGYQDFIILPVNHVNDNGLEGLAQFVMIGCELSFSPFPSRSPPFRKTILSVVGWLAPAGWLVKHVVCKLSC